MKALLFPLLVAAASNLQPATARFMKDDVTPFAGCAAVTALEKSSLKLINDMRQEEGLEVLKLSKTLAKIAHFHSIDRKLHGHKEGCSPHSWGEKVEGSPFEPCCEEGLQPTFCQYGKLRQAVPSLTGAVSLEAIFTKANGPFKTAEEVVKAVLASPYEGMRLMQRQAYQQMKFGHAAVKLDVDSEGNGVAYVWMGRNVPKVDEC